MDLYWNVDGEVTWRPTKNKYAEYSSFGNSTWMNLMIKIFGWNSVMDEIKYSIRSQFNILLDVGFQYNFHSYTTDEIALAHFISHRTMDIRFIETLKLVNGSVHLLFHLHANECIYCDSRESIQLKPSLAQCHFLCFVHFGFVLVWIFLHLLSYHF